MQLPHHSLSQPICSVRSIALSNYLHILVDLGRFWAVEWSFSETRSQGCRNTESSVCGLVTRLTVWFPTKLDTKMHFVRLSLRNFICSLAIMEAGKSEMDGKRQES